MSTLPIFVAPLHSFPRIQRPPIPNERPRPRATTPQQGRALELLGHAIEYLIDSRVGNSGKTPAEAAAVHLLMVCSRAIFSECTEVEPWRMRLQSAMARSLRWRVSHVSPT